MDRPTLWDNCHWPDCDLDHPVFKKERKNENKMSLLQTISRMRARLAATFARGKAKRTWLIR